MNPPAPLPPYDGSCLCSAVRYRLHHAIKAVSHCHCGQCRKAHGAAFASYGSVPRAVLEWLSGQDQLRAYRSSPTVLREFCGVCGSSLFWSNSAGDYPDWVSVALGTLDSELVAARQQHIYTDTKVCWLDIADIAAPMAGA